MKHQTEGCKCEKEIGASKAHVPQHCEHGQVARHRQLWVDAGVDYGRCLCGCGAKTSIAAQSHTQFGRVNGEPLRFVVGHRRPRPIGERFWPKVDKDGPGGCWLWNAAKDRKGYGRLAVKTLVGVRPVLAHRIAYELLVGSIPESLELDHLCRVPACVNPEHLEPVTHAENMRRTRGHRERASHCQGGHALSGDNLYVRPDGARICRSCKNRQERERRRRA